MKKSKTISAALALCSLSFLQISCTVDNDYVVNDWKEISPDVTIFGDGATIPLGRSEQIHLDDAIKMSKDTSIRDYIVKNADGTFSLRKKGVYDLSSVIKSIDVKKLSEIDGFSFNSPFSFHVDLKDVAFTSLRRAAVPGRRGSGNMKKTQKLEKQLTDIKIIDSTVVAKFPAQVKNITRAELEGVNLDMKIVFSNLPSIAGATYSIDSVQITLPSFLETANGTNVVKFTGSKTIANTTPVVLDPIALNALKDIDIEDRTSIMGDVAISYYLTVEAASLPGTVTADITATMTSKIGNSATPSKLKITKALAGVEYETTDTSSIKLGKMPEFLQGGSVNLAMDPIFNVKIRSNFGVPADAALTIIPYIQGKAQEDSVDFAGLELPQSADAADTVETKYMIASSAHLPTEPGVVKIEEDLAPLVKRIPDSYKIKVNALVDRYETSILQPAATYACKMDYELDVPIRFGDNFNLAFNIKSEINNDAATFFKIGPVVLSLALVNTMTVGFTCTISVLDKNGNELALESPVALDVKAGDGHTVTTQKFSPKLSVKNASAAEFGNLLLKMKLNPVTNADIKADQYVQATTMSVTLPEGATFSEKK